MYSSKPSFFNVEAMFRFELRVVYLSPLLVFFMVIGLRLLAQLAAGLFALSVFLLDLIVSVMLTRAFLQPIVDVLGVVENQAAKDLRRTMYLVVVGSSIAVFSSSILYVNAIFFFAFKESCSKSVWLNILVFGINVDSILNDVGLLLVCGVFKHWSVQLPKFHFDPQSKYKFWVISQNKPDSSSHGYVNKSSSSKSNSLHSSTACPQQTTIVTNSVAIPVLAHGQE